jgi:Leu/Phe-tRNA-protein transferase
MGGELTVPWLLAAYRRGIFPVVRRRSRPGAVVVA